MTLSSRTTRKLQIGDGVDVKCTNIKALIIHCVKGKLGVCWCLRAGLWFLRGSWNWREKGQFLEAPLPVSSDVASKASRLKALRWLQNQARPVLENGRR